MKHPRELEKILGAAGGFAPKGAFIAGGALTSAFSNQQINDVDYYFKSQQAFHEKFSIEAAMKLLQTDGAIIEVKSEAMPSSWEEMIRFIEILKTNPGASYRDDLSYEEFKEWQKTIHARMDALYALNPENFKSLL